MSRNVLIAVVVVLLLVVGGWYVMRPTYTTPTEAPTSSASAIPTASSAAAMSDVKEIKVTATDFVFTPASLSVKKGDKVKMVLQNDGKYPHNLIIDELGVASKTIKAGESDSVEVTVSKTGTFAMYCSVDAHRQKGMEGKFLAQ